MEGIVYVLHIKPFEYIIYANDVRVVDHEFCIFSQRVREVE